METLFELRAKRKKALIAVLTLGLSQAPWKELFKSSEEAGEGMSFSGTVFGFIFKIMWFIAWTVLTTLVLWVINIFKLLIYSIKIYSFEKQSI